VPGEIGTRSARLEDLPAPDAPPVRVRVGSLGIDAPVVAIGVEPGTVAVAVPDDVSVAGWYRFGPAPGDDGSAVLTAHVDSAAQGAGAFFPLRDAALGAEVVVTSADGAAHRFQVVARRSYRKTELPVGALFTRTGDPVLTLITCGGAFDAATRSYEENLVVYATPIDGPPTAG
jgi:sortase (surface protein transpeptidase)